MKHDIDRQVDAYRLAVDCGVVPKSPRCTADQQVERYRTSREEDAELVARAREILNEVGVSRIVYVWYYAFVRQVTKLARRYTDQVLALETQSITALWCARGLDMSVLNRLREEVLGIAEPKMP